MVNIFGIGAFVENTIKSPFLVAILIFQENSIVGKFPLLEPKWSVYSKKKIRLENRAKNYLYYLVAFSFDKWSPSDGDFDAFVC